MKSRGKMWCIMGTIFFCVLCVACTPTRLYKSVTVETNPDGTTKEVVTESITQTINTTEELKLDKVKMQ